MSREHVIPQGLFANALPGDLPKIPVCEPCNNKKSRYDTYLRDFLLLDMDSCDQPEARELFPRLERAIPRKQSEMAYHAMQSRIVSLYTPSKVYAGIAYATDLPKEPITTSLAYITRGLYRYYYNDMLPLKSTFHVARLRDMDAIRDHFVTFLATGAAWKRVGEGNVFECIYSKAIEKPEVSIWFLRFFKGVFFSVVTNHRYRQLTTNQ
jgi:hypothetical protein